MVKKIKISEELLNVILDEVPVDLWDYWMEYSPKIYKEFVRIRVKYNGG